MIDQGREVNRCLPESQHQPLVTMRIVQYCHNVVALLPSLSTLLSKSLTLIYTNKEISLDLFYFQSKLSVAAADKTWSLWSRTPVPRPSYPHHQNL